MIALYVESVGNPRKFARIARRVSASKPIIAIKAGRSPAGQRAGLSHTAAAAASDVVVDALFTQAGVLRVDTMDRCSTLPESCATNRYRAATASRWSAIPVVRAFSPRTLPYAPAWMS